LTTVIAIDGPAASGKGTLAQRLAKALGFAHLDTGLLYRAVGAKVAAEGGHHADQERFIAAAQRLSDSDLQRSDLRGAAAARMASIGAAIPEVRAALLDYQRRFAEAPPGQEPGAILEGRDIGTVVCPDAAAKLFLTAAVEVRARRRVAELQGRGEAAIYATVLQELQDRDRRDQERTVAPLKPAADAVVLDTTELDADQALEKALAIVRERLAVKTKAAARGSG
jgi:cytidylate kinase